MIAVTFDNSRSTADISRIDGKNLDVDDGLETAVILSLFTDARATSDDDTPDSYLGGWWGDTYPAAENDKFGSRLWLLRRGKATSQNIERARSYTKEALQWLIDDGVADSIAVEAEFQSPSRLALRVEIKKPGDVAARWERTWEVTLGV